MTNLEKYNLWVSKVTDPELSAELKSLKGSEIDDRFFADVEFGTGGLRGKLGAGTYYMNKYTVGQATQGIADYMNKNGLTSCVIGYDSRIKSDYFADLSARILAENGITVYIYPTLIPTPLVSYAVRKLGAGMGIMITASHNPKQYNGYKAYNSTGCQIANEMADEIYACIKAVDPFNGVKICESSPLIVTIGEETYQSYLDEVEKCAIKQVDASKLSILYTPLSGTGNRPVRDILARRGFNVEVVQSQEHPDGTFATCPYPNPEFREAYNEAFKVAQKLKPDLIIATDPDADRIGIAVKKAKKTVDGKANPADDDAPEYVLMTGNEVGLMLFEYMIKNGGERKNPVVVKTIVTTALLYNIAKKYGVRVKDTLTGFKYIGEFMNDLEAENRTNEYVLGFEESYGYLIGTHGRDKDAVVSAMLIAEMATDAHQNGLTLIDVMEQIYADYGYIGNKTLNIAFEGAKGKGEMNALLAKLRGMEITKFGNMHVASRTDFLHDDTGLPKSDVLRYTLIGGEVIIRPSGTEPKMKMYLTVVSDNPHKSTEMLKALEDSILSIIK